MIPLDPTHGTGADHAAEQAAGHGCAWWNLVCQGGHQVVDSGLSAITRTTADGANQLLGGIVKTIDESTQVPITDPTYRHIYVGFLGLAVPLMGVTLCLALVVAAVRRDPGTLARAVGGLLVAGLGGALYLVLAQLLVGLDNWLSHGVVRVTGHDLTDGLTEMAAGFAHLSGSQGELSANMLLILLMLTMLVAGLVLWFVLVLRKIAILVVVAFAPLLIAGYLWAPTRPWVTPRHRVDRRIPSRHRANQRIHTLRWTIPHLRGDQSIPGRHWTGRSPRTERRMPSRRRPGPHPRPPLQVRPLNRPLTPAPMEVPRDQPAPQRPDPLPVRAARPRRPAARVPRPAARAVRPRCARRPTRVPVRHHQRPDPRPGPRGTDRVPGGLPYPGPPADRLVPPAGEPRLPAR